MQQILSTEDLGNGLIFMTTSQGAVYTANGRQFEVCGEYDSGEAWLNGAHYCYERDDGDVLLTDVRTGEVEHTFEDTEQGWDAFAREQLNK